MRRDQCLDIYCHHGRANRYHNTNHTLFACYLPLLCVLLACFLVPGCADLTALLLHCMREMRGICLLLCLCGAADSALDSLGASRGKKRRRKSTHSDAAGVGTDAGTVVVVAVPTEGEGGEGGDADADGASVAPGASNKAEDAEAAASTPSHGTTGRSSGSSGRGSAKGISLNDLDKGSKKRRANATPPGAAASGQLQDALRAHREESLKDLKGMYDFPISTRSCRCQLR